MNFDPQKTQASGFCTRCKTVHRLPMGIAQKEALELIKILDREKRLDFHVEPEDADPGLSTDYLFGKARGKMFGTMVCLRLDGTVITIKAFSGQYNGVWQIQGWAPPLFDLTRWHRINDETEREIKKMGVEIAALNNNGHPSYLLVEKRKERSRELMKALHDLYMLRNFRGRSRPLSQVYTQEGNGIPNGTADCSGPKLLNFAAMHNLVPLGLAEFYYGRENKKGNRKHGQFYASCLEKCAPIMGYLLCGLKEI